MAAKSTTDAQSGIEAVPASLPKEALIPEEYNFKHPRRGVCIIINNKHFDVARTGQREREGTDLDAEKVESTFAKLGFDIHRHDDLSATDLSITMRKLSKEDHSDADCFVCVILSHGKEGRVYGTDGTVTIDTLTNCFKADECPSLAGKPKLFFIQACRGTKLDYGAEVEDTDFVDALIAESPDPPALRRIPTVADFLMAYSVVPGHFSWRNNIDGSWFIMALCDVLETHGDSMELMHMMTLVNKVVAYEFAACTDSEFTQDCKQVPCMVSMLTKQVYFKPKY